MSTINYYDRVKDTSVSTGTGDFTLANSPASGFRSFDSAAGHAGNHFPYVIDGGANVEVGYGHLSDATTLVRDTVLYSTNANALVSFPAGAKTVFIDVPAEVFSRMMSNVPKVYRCLLAQSGGTDDPTVTVLENTLGGDVVWTRIATGNMKGTLTGAFTDGKTFIPQPSVDLGQQIGDESFLRAGQLDADSVFCLIQAIDFSTIDGLGRGFFGVFVYP